MTFTDFKTEVAAWMNRDSTVFTTVGSTTVLELAINDVKREAQFTVDFAGAMVDGYILTGPSGAELATTTTTSGGVTTINVNRAIKLWMLSDNGGRYKSIPIQYDNVLERLTPTEDANPPTPYRAYIRGTKIYLTGVADGTNCILECVKWMPDYSGSVTTDFFLDYYHSWFLLAVLKRLTPFLKEDQRALISARACDEAWERVLGREASLTPNYGLD